MIKNLSYSQVDTLGKCQRLWQYRYLDKVPAPTKAAMLRGNAYHEALAFAYSNKIMTGEFASVADAKDIYSSAWDKATADKAKPVDFDGKDPGKMKDAGLYLVELYCQTIMPTIKPVAVEKRYEIVYEGIKLVGYVDLITEDGTIIDHKLGEKSRSESDVIKDQQSSFYGLILGKDEVDFHLHHALALKKPDIKIIKIHRSKSDIQWVGGLVKIAWGIVQSGLYMPCSQGWWCAPKQCPYWDICHAITAPDDF